MLAIDIKSVEGKFLGNDLEFLHPLGHQFAHFLQDLFLRTTHMLTCNNRNGAIGTMAVAPLTDLQVGIVVRRSEMALVGIISHTLMTEVGYEFPVVELPIELIHFGQFLLQLLGIALRQATHHEQFSELSFLLPLNHLQNGVDTLFFGISDEPTGVHDNDLPTGIPTVVHTMVAVLFEQLHENLAVNKILGTTHCDDINLILNH